MESVCDHAHMRVHLWTCAKAYMTQQPLTPTVPLSSACINAYEVYTTGYCQVARVVAGGA